MTSVTPRTMDWYLVHTKPRQESTAAMHLNRQGFHCFLPMTSSQKLRGRRVEWVDEPLFPRYLFIQLGLGMDDLSWAPIRSTVGVHRLVRFGNAPAKVPGAIVEWLQACDAQRQVQDDKPWAQPGQKVRIVAGPFAGREAEFEALWESPDGEQRALVLLELISRKVRVPVPPSFIHL